MTEIRALVEKSGIPFLPMSMAKGLLPDTHPQSRGRGALDVLKEADVVMLIGARLNWLLSHGKGKTWGEPGSKKFIQIDIEPKEMDSNVEIAAPVVGDIGSCVSALLDGHGRATGRRRRPTGSAPINERKAKKTSPRWRRDAGEEPVADGLPQRARRRCATVIKERPDAILVNEGANTLDFARGVDRHVSSRASASTSAPGASWASAWASPSPPPSRPASR